MTKKHFIALADALRAAKPFDGLDYAGKAQWALDVERIADFCASQNPQFNRERWLSYIEGNCGKNGGKINQTVNA